MIHEPIPAGELTARLSRLRDAMSSQYPNWSMILLENKIDLYYFTGVMPEGVFVVTPEEAILFVRRPYEQTTTESQWRDIRPMKSFRVLAETFSTVPDTVYVAAKTLTLQKVKLLQKYLPFSDTVAIDAILADLRSVKSEYELDCMRQAGKIHQRVIEEVAPTLFHPGICEARLCSEICTALIREGAMGISRFQQPAAEDVLGITSFSEDALCASALDSPSGTIGTCIAMKSIGSSERLLREGDVILLDIPSGYRGYHTDKSITFFFGALSQSQDAGRIRAAHEQCIALERQAASLLIPGAVPAEIYEKLCNSVDVSFREGFMNGCKFVGHSIGLFMDESPALASGFQKPIQAGMTFAVEPKIALPGIGLIGSENTYEIVSNGSARSLTGNCNTTLEVL